MLFSYVEAIAVMNRHDPSITILDSLFMQKDTSLKFSHNIDIGPKLLSGNLTEESHYISIF